MEVAGLTRIVHKKEEDVGMKRVRAFVADDSGQGVVETVLIIPATTNRKNNVMAIATFTAGPATATASSWLGRSGMRSKLATPPIGSSVMRCVPIPNRRAINACPSS